MSFTEQAQRIVTECTKLSGESLAFFNEFRGMQINCDGGHKNYWRALLSGVRRVRENSTR